MSAGRTPSVPTALVASFERVSDVRLSYVEFCYLYNTPGARFTNTLLRDCCLKTRLFEKSDLVQEFVFDLNYPYVNSRNNSTIVWLSLAFFASLYGSLMRVYYQKLRKMTHTIIFPFDCFRCFQRI